MTDISARLHVGCGALPVLLTGGLARTVNLPALDHLKDTETFQQAGLTSAESKSILEQVEATAYDTPATWQRKASHGIRNLVVSSHISAAATAYSILVYDGHVYSANRCYRMLAGAAVRRIEDAACK